MTERAGAAAEDATLRKVNALLGHWMGGINPCICMRCKDVAAYVVAAVAQAVTERDAAEGWLASLADAVNGWLREAHLEHLQSKGYHGSAIRDALDQLGYAYNKQAEALATERSNRMS